MLIFTRASLEVLAKAEVAIGRDWASRHGKSSSAHGKYDAEQGEKPIENLQSILR